jgi:site-specific recombinase XerD
MGVAAASNRRPADVPTDDEVRALIAACSTRAPTGIRNRALIAVLWRCGLRIAEALALRAADVNLDSQQSSLRVAHGKGDKSRTVGIDPGTAALLARWMDRRKALGFNGRQPLFCTITTGTRKGVKLAAGSSMEQSYVRHLLRRLAAKAGIERPIHPHSLRHAFAHGLARENTSMVVIRDALGHSSLAVTDRYLRDIAPVHVIGTMQQREWTL